MSFQTAVAQVQVLNVHLRPPVSDRGSWVSGYLSTGDDRLREIKQFYAHRRKDLPMRIWHANGRQTLSRTPGQFRA